MTQTTYYEFNKPEGADLVNPLVDTIPNWDALDADLHDFNERSIANCTEVVSLGVHAISRLDTTAKFLKWIATANFTAGDTFVVDGNAVAAATPAGAALATDAYVSGSVVLACLNSDNTAMTIYVSGTNVATDSARLGGELPSYYATASDMGNAQTDITNIQNLEGNTSIVGIGDGTLTGAVSSINADLANIESTTLTLIDTITTINSATEYTFDFSAYKEVLFVIIGSFSSASNKWHVVHKYSLEEINLIRNDTNYLCTEFTPNLPALTIDGAVGNGAFVHVNIGLNPNDDTKFKFQKNSNTYSFNALKIYGVKKVIN